MENRMRYKAAVLALIIGAASILGVVRVSSSVAKTADEVSFSMLESSGDSSWAEGLKLSFTEQVAHNLYTDSVIGFGSAGQGSGLTAETSHFYAKAYAYPYFRADITVSIASGDYGNALYEDLRKMSMELQPGEFRTVTVKLSDYYESLPLKVCWNKPGNTFAERSSGSTDFDYEVSGGRDYIYEQFAQYFSRRIAEGETVDCEIGKTSGGVLQYVVDWRMSSSSQLCGVLCGDYYYLSASWGGLFRLQEDKVWRIPCGELAEPIRSKWGTLITQGPLVGQAELFLEIDASHSLSGNYPVRLSDDGNTVFIHTINGKTTRVYCVSDAGSEKASVSAVDVSWRINDYDSDAVDPNSYLFTEDSMVFRGLDNTMYCIHPEGGKYALTEFFGDTEEAPIDARNGVRIANVVKCAYKDGKLAIVRYVYKKVQEEDGTEQWHYGGLNLSVCSTGKVEYSVLIQSSIVQGMYFRTNPSGGGFYRINSLSW